MSQSRLHSFIEAWANIVIGFAINFGANLVLFPAFGYPISPGKAFHIGLWFTGISLVRSYFLRRLFNRFHRGFYAQNQKSS